MLQTDDGLCVFFLSFFLSLHVSQKSHVVFDNNSNHDEERYALKTTPHFLRIILTVVCMEYKRVNLSLLGKLPYSQKLQRFHLRTNEELNLAQSQIK